MPFCHFPRQAVVQKHHAAKEEHYHCTVARRRLIASEQPAAHCVFICMHMQAFINIIAGVHQWEQIVVEVNLTTFCTQANQLWAGRQDLLVWADFLQPSCPPPAFSTYPGDGHFAIHLCLPTENMPGSDMPGLSWK